MIPNVQHFNWIKIKLPIKSTCSLQKNETKCKLNIIFFLRSLWKCIIRMIFGATRIVWLCIPLNFTANLYQKKYKIENKIAVVAYCLRVKIYQTFIYLDENKNPLISKKMIFKATKISLHFGIVPPAAK